MIKKHALQDSIAVKCIWSGAYLTNKNKIEKQEWTITGCFELAREISEFALHILSYQVAFFF